MEMTARFSASTGLEFIFQEVLIVVQKRWWWVSKMLEIFEMGADLVNSAATRGDMD
jgi:hypothetical protein